LEGEGGEAGIYAKGEKNSAFSKRLTGWDRRFNFLVRKKGRTLRTDMRQPTPFRNTGNDQKDSHVYRQTTSDVSVKQKKKGLTTLWGGEHTRKDGASIL